MAEIMPETFWWKYIKNNRVHFLVIYIFLYMTNGRKLERTKMSFKISIIWKTVWHQVQKFLRQKLRSNV